MASPSCGNPIEFPSRRAAMLPIVKRLLRFLVPLRLREKISVARHRGRLALGVGSRVHRSAQILGRAHVRIGANSSIAERSWLNVNHPSPNGFAITIGDHTFIGRDNFMSSGRSIRIGSYCLTTLGCKFVCSTHVTDSPWMPIVMTGTTAIDLIDVGDNCFFGVNATVLGSVTIGHGSVIGAGALVISDLPPFSLAVGSPARVVKRYSFKRRAWIPLQEIMAEDLSENPGPEAYLRMLQSAAPTVEMPWIASGADQGSF